MNRDSCRCALTSLQLRESGKDEVIELKGNTRISEEIKFKNEDAGKERWVRFNWNQCIPRKLKNAALFTELKNSLY